MAVLSNYIRKFYSGTVNEDRANQWADFLDNAGNWLLSWLRSPYQNQQAAQNFNAQQSALQRADEWKMYEDAKMWNTPANQMRLYKEAGLNPHLLYGNPLGSTASPSGGMSEASISPAGSGISPMNLFNSGVDAIRGLSTIPEQKELLSAQAAEVRSRVPVNEQKVLVLKSTIDDVLSRISERAAHIQLMYSQKNLTDEQRENISFEQMIKRGQLDISYKQLELNSQLTAAQVEQLQANTKELLARAGVQERELQEMIWTYAVRAQGLQKQNLLTDAMIRQADATADKLRKEGIRVEQLTAIDAPKEINAQSWADDMSGKNGKVNQVGANITYQIVEGIKQVGGVLLR